MEELRLEELRPGIWQRYPPNRITKTITRPIIFEPEKCTPRPGAPSRAGPGPGVFSPCRRQLP